MPTTPIHALVVGGTGMLREVSYSLARDGHIVSVIARRHSRLLSLAQSAAEEKGVINSLAVDYQNTDALRQALQEAQTTYGPIEKAVVWIHSTAPDAPYVVANALQGEHILYAHIFGSDYANPAHSDDEFVRIKKLDHILYKAIILGFIREGNYSRWLTHTEISSGILNALKTNDKRCVVGTVTPWSARP